MNLIFAAVGAFLFAVAVKVTSDAVTSAMSKRSLGFHIDTVSLFFVSLAVRILPRGQRQRYSEEWLSYLSDLNASPLRRLAEAALLCKSAVLIDLQMAKLASDSVFKRTFDACLAAIGILFLAPLLLLVALAVRISMAGFVLRAVSRVGKGGQHFHILKFATTEEQADGSVTCNALGRFLRRASIDELPILLNVLRGEMSIVGPRPLLIEERERMTPKQAALHLKVKPGITGLSQLQGATGLNALALDQEYIEKASIALDIKIIWMTLRKEFLHGDTL